MHSPSGTFGLRMMTPEPGSHGPKRDVSTRTASAGQYIPPRTIDLRRRIDRISRDVENGQLPDAQSSGVLHFDLQRDVGAPGIACNK
jgi:hypothetical protein